MGKAGYIGIAAVALSCLIYIVTGLISMNCLADGNDDCAQKSGLAAVMFGCMACIALGGSVYWLKKHS